VHACEAFKSRCTELGIDALGILLRCIKTNLEY
jgi:hypothetical protein